MLSAMHPYVSVPSNLPHLQMPPGSGAGLRCAVVRVVRGAAPTAARYVDLRVAVAGGIDSGKSSLVSCGGVSCWGLVGSCWTSALTP